MKRLLLLTAISILLIEVSTSCTNNSAPSAKMTNGETATKEVLKEPSLSKWESWKVADQTGIYLSDSEQKKLDLAFQDSLVLYCNMLLRINGGAEAFLILKDMKVVDQKNGKTYVVNGRLHCFSNENNSPCPNTKDAMVSGNKFGETKIKFHDNTMTNELSAQVTGQILIFVSSKKCWELTNIPSSKYQNPGSDTPKQSKVQSDPK